MAESPFDFFESRVRPVLVEHCYKCHSAGSEKLKGELYLDSRDGLLKGGVSGPAIVPGNPEKSLLIKAIRYTDSDLRMPPQKDGVEKLSPEQIANLEEWVKIGAPDPRTNSAHVAKATDGADHWAFKPVGSPTVPEVRNQPWIQTPVDNFILAKLELQGIEPNPPADKRDLIRRASFDLLGLPPTPEQVDAFLNDSSPDAFGRVVEEFLDSAHYGERWGRYWLDIARYADTKGYVFEEERRFPYSYTYRDYVIRAFNEDMPFDRFIVEQLAADTLELGDDKRALAALGFLTLGRRFLNNQPDIIDDRIDVVTRGLMGLTVSCARCHDHKYDPIPTQDYYSLYGVFSSSREPNEKPLLGSAALPPEYPQYLTEREKRESELTAFREKKETELRTRLHSQVGDYLLVVHDGAKAADDKKEQLARQRKLSPQVASRWREKLEAWSKDFHPVFAPWLALSALEEKDFSVKASDALGSAARDTNTVNPIVAQHFAEAPASLREAADRYNKLFAEIDKLWKETLATHANSNSAVSGPNRTGSPTALPDANAEALRQILYASDSPTAFEPGSMMRQLNTEDQQRLRALRRKVDEIDATHPGSPPRSMALVDSERPQNARVFRRGNANNPGDEVPRQFIKVIAGPDRKPFEKGSGRLELAKAIASPDNPLTARVLVNRVWMYHFGAPLVRTPGDFGVRSEPPTHPELLDWLASRFVREGWSVKKLHRWIMLSSAYGQSTANNPAAAKIDPANQLLWRMNRRRLDFEATRDTLLAVSGRLDAKLGGRPVDITVDPSPPRRTIYGFVERQNLPGLFRTFDFASPDTTSPQRFTTTVPQQALFMMNSPLLLQLATNFAARTDAASPDEKRVRLLYRNAFQREPDIDEVQAALRFVQNHASVETSDAPAWQYGWGHYDAETKQVNFQPLPHFNNYSWQGGKELPDAKLGWVLLNAEGGHPGNDPEHAAIRRWIAPRDGAVRIAGDVHHASEKGDGVRARVISSRNALVGEWTAFKGSASTPVERLEVKKGDTIDFVTDCRASVEFDSFTWSPSICYLAKSDALRAEWSAKMDFAGPRKEKPTPLDAWGKFAQVLLLANELVFVD